MSSIEIIPTCVPKGTEDIANAVGTVRGFAPAVHIDIDDGLFAPVFTWPYFQKGVFGDISLEVLRGFPAEIHLMVQEPRAIGIQFARAGTFRILAHLEAFSSAEEARGTLDAWRREGVREVGLAALLHTPLEILDPLVVACDLIHLMSIATIGTQGIPYETSAPSRIAEFHARHPEILISVDGGVSDKNIADLVRAGATHFGVGAAIFRATDPAQAYKNLQSLAEGAL